MLGKTDLQRICEGLRYSTRDRASSEFPKGARVRLAFWREFVSHGLIDHEIQTNLPAW